MRNITNGGNNFHESRINSCNLVHCIYNYRIKTLPERRTYKMYAGDNFNDTYDMII